MGTVNSRSGQGFAILHRPASGRKGTMEHESDQKGDGAKNCRVDISAFGHHDGVSALDHSAKDRIP